MKKIYSHFLPFFACLVAFKLQAQETPSVNQPQLTHQQMLAAHRQQLYQEAFRQPPLVVPSEGAVDDRAEIAQRLAQVQEREIDLRLQRALLQAERRSHLAEGPARRLDENLMRSAAQRVLFGRETLYFRGLLTPDASPLP